jgi:CheY-like chemotaxis protein
MRRILILVIEDNAGNLELMRVVLEMAGYEVMSAESADAGLEKARQSRPDLILMDMHLPGMDGYQATRIIKSDPDLKDIPVIAVTAICGLSDEKRVLENGCDGYINKPVNTRTLADQIAGYLEGKKE